jgi:hypothetical protein
VHGCVDIAGLGVDDHVARIGLHRSIRVPVVAGGVEHRVAADEEILVGAKGKPGRTAIMHRISWFHSG